MVELKKVVVEPKQYSSILFFLFFLEFYNNFILQVFFSLFGLNFRKSSNCGTLQVSDIKFDGYKAALLITNAFSYLFICTLMEVLSIMTKKAVWERALLKLIKSALAMLFI